MFSFTAILLWLIVCSIDNDIYQYGRDRILPGLQIIPPSEGRDITSIFFLFVRQMSHLLPLDVGPRISAGGERSTLSTGLKVKWSMVAWWHLGWAKVDPRWGYVFPNVKNCSGRCNACEGDQNTVNIQEDDCMSFRRFEESDEPGKRKPIYL